ncbi:MAG TPA: hypothetical protein VEM95_07455, partial [Thermoplasmata archaeon]|nr:hypothetical protein [Thermoplasmata archaeon]
HWWIAAHLARTGLYVDPMSLMTQGSWLPGYYPVGAALFDLFNWGALDALRWISLAASLGTLVLVFLVARPRGLLAAGFAGLFYALVIQDALVASMALPESLVVVCVFGGAYLLFRENPFRGRTKLVATSLLLLAAVSLRYEAWVAVALLPMWAWRMRQTWLRTSFLVVSPSAFFALAWILVLLPMGFLPSIVFGQTAREAQNQIALGTLPTNPLARVWTFWFDNYAVGLLPMFLVGPAYMIVRERGDYGTWLALAMFLGVTALVGLGGGTGSYRYLAIAVPFLAVSSGRGVDALLRRAPHLIPRVRGSPRAARVVIAAAALALVAASAANAAWITPRLDGIGQLNNPVRRAGEWIAAHPMPDGASLLSDSPIATYYAHVDPARAWSSWWLPDNRTDALAVLKADYAYVVFVNVSYYPLRLLFPELAAGRDTADFTLAFDPNGWELQYGAKAVYVYAPRP